MGHLLSKSKYIRGLQCDRALWLDVFNPRLARYTAEQMRRFDRGREFEYAFKDTFPNGIDISAILGRKVDLYPELTAQYLDGVHTPSPLRGTPPNLGGEQPATAILLPGSSPETGEGDRREAVVEGYEPLTLFEAGFFYDDVLVLADVVHRNEDGSLDIYEVKSGTVLSDTYKRDAALQHYVISHCREVRRFSLVYRNPELPESPEAPGIPYIIEEVTDYVAAQHDEIARNIAAMKEILSHGEPATPTGAHCLEPYACPYQHYCAQGIRQMSLF